jgi:F-type H+-transporting ATPase subunit b
MPLLLAASFIDVRPGLIFWTLVTFAIVAIVLRVKAWGPILQLVEERERKISEAIEQAQKERAEAEKMLAEQKVAIAQARKESADMLRKNQAEMEKFRDTMMAEAKSKAEAELTNARRQIQEERVKAVAEVKAMSVSLAIEIARKLIGSELDENKHRVLAEKFIDELPRPGAQA